MPDLATALQQAINNIQNKEKQMTNTTNTTTDQTNNNLSALANAWAADDPTERKPAHVTSTPTGGPNTSRNTFNFVRDNPGVNKADILNSLSAEGMNPASVATLLTQMLMCGTIRRDEEGRFFANVREYVPVKLGVLRAIRKANKRQKKTTKVKAAAPKRLSVAKPAVESKAVEAAQHMWHGIPVPAPITSTPTEFDPDTYLSKLSFTQVLALYKHLKQILGNV